MAGERFYVLFCQHFGFHAEEMFEFTVVDFHISCGDNEDCMVLFFAVKRQGFCNPGRGGSYCLGSQLHSSAGLGKFPDIILPSQGFEILFYRF